jgi:hypothetical protein
MLLANRETASVNITRIDIAWGREESMKKDRVLFGNFE